MQHTKVGDAVGGGRRGVRGSIDLACPACGCEGMDGFHLTPAPANSNLLLADAAAARAFPTGIIELALCSECGFITNAAFDPALARYGEGYEETQGFSPRFLRFARDLARAWIERYDLAGKRVLEIGCGKGEFLALMADEGIGYGIGIDPGVVVDRTATEHSERLKWLPRLFTADDADLIGDAVVCRHTLEHIHEVNDFLSGLRRVIGERHDTVILFELPDTLRVLSEVAFWDVYYEHCSYFTQGSLSRLFERCGFQVLDLRYEYDDQYLILEARPVPAGTRPVPWGPDDLGAIADGVDGFVEGYTSVAARWRDRLAALAAKGGTAVVWGASSKAVAFLGVVGDHVAAAVDINPNKHGTFVAGTGHPILAPAELAALKPDLVVAMNPIYLEEIQADLDRLGVTSDLVGL